MHIELQQAMQHLVAEQSLNLKEISRFTPVDFRLGIQYLVAQDQPDLAQALAEAHQVLETALQKWPNDATLIQERNAMATAVQDAMPAPSLTN